MPMIRGRRLSLDSLVVLRKAGDYSSGKRKKNKSATTKENRYEKETEKRNGNHFFVCFVVGATNGHRTWSVSSSLLLDWLVVVVLLF